MPLRFARHLTGMEDANSPLAQVMGRYVPDFEPHFANLSNIADDAIRGEVATQLFVLVLKYIFTDRLGGHLDEILALASKDITCGVATNFTPSTRPYAPLARRI